MTKRAAWTTIMSAGVPFPFEIRAGQKGHGHLLAGTWQIAYCALPLGERIASMEAAVRAMGYTLRSWEESKPMPETQPTMLYRPLQEDAPGAAAVYQCCGQWCYQAPQAMFHLWREHGLTAEAAWAHVDACRAPLARPSPGVPTVSAAFHAVPLHTVQDAAACTIDAPDDVGEQAPGEILPTATPGGSKLAWRDTLEAHQWDVALPYTLSLKVRLALNPISQTSEVQGCALARLVLEALDHAAQEFMPSHTQGIVAAINAVHTTHGRDADWIRRYWEKILRRFRVAMSVQLTAIQLHGLQDEAEQWYAKEATTRAHVETLAPHVSSHADDALDAILVRPAVADAASPAVSASGWRAMLAELLMSLGDVTLKHEAENLLSKGDTTTEAGQTMVARVLHACEQQDPDASIPL